MWFLLLYLVVTLLPLPLTLYIIITIIIIVRKRHRSKSEEYELSPIKSSTPHHSPNVAITSFTSSGNPESSQTFILTPYTSFAESSVSALVPQRTQRSPVVTGLQNQRHFLDHYLSHHTKWAHLKIIFLISQPIHILKDFENASPRLNPLFHKP